MPQINLSVNNLFQQRVRLRRHDEIVFVQAADFMRPPLKGDSPPLGDNQWVMIFLLGNRADFIREFQGLNKVLELEDALQAFHATHFLDLPFGNLWLKFHNLSVGQSRFAAAAGDAFLLR